MLYRILILLLMLSSGSALACERFQSLADAVWLAQRGDHPGWSDPGLDDNKWTHVTRGEKLPKVGFGPQDGFFWYRLHFHLQEGQSGRDCYISLGRIQETDEVFLNGTQIGGEGRLGEHWFDFVSAMRQPRGYKLPLALLHADGDNVLAVRSFSLYLTGGMRTSVTGIGPSRQVFDIDSQLLRETERIEVVTLTLLTLAGLVTGFLSLTRRSERHHVLLFGLILAVGTIYLVDAVLFYPVRMEMVWTKRLVMLAGPAIPLLVLRYLSAVSGQLFPRWLWLVAILPLLTALPMLFNHPLHLIVRLYDIWFLSFVPFIGSAIAVMVRRTRYRMHQSGMALTAGIVISVGLLFALLGDLEVPGSINPIEIGILGMTAILTTAFGRRLKREHEARLRLSAGVLSAQDEERRRIARELHDGLGQRLVAVRLMLEAESLLQPNSPLKEAVRELRDTTRELRAIVHGLRPVELGEVSLRTALNSYSERVRELTGVHVQIDYTHHGYVPAEVEEHLFRIFQEAISNATRHGGAHEVRIRLSGIGAQLLVTINDDGSGFKIDTRTQGLGLAAMAERVRLCNGHLNIESRIGGGTTLRIEIPLG